MASVAEVAFMETPQGLRASVVAAGASALVRHRWCGRVLGTYTLHQGLHASVVAAGASALVRLMLRLAFSAAAFALSGCWKILLKPSLPGAPKACLIIFKH